MSLYFVFYAVFITHKSTFRVHFSNNKAFDELLDYIALSQLITLYTLFLHLCELS